MDLFPQHNTLMITAHYPGEEKVKFQLSVLGWAHCTSKHSIGQNHAGFKHEWYTIYLYLVWLMHIKSLSEIPPSLLHQQIFILWLYFPLCPMLFFPRVSHFPRAVPRKRKTRVLLCCIPKIFLAARFHYLYYWGMFTRITCPTALHYKESPLRKKTAHSSSSQKAYCRHQDHHQTQSPPGKKGAKRWDWHYVLPYTKTSPSLATTAQCYNLKQTPYIVIPVAATPWLYGWSSLYQVPLQREISTTKDL